eukprot:jgi/Tetstr1/440624/TSEL_028934.t1
MGWLYRLGDTAPAAVVQALNKSGWKEWGKHNRDEPCQLYWKSAKFTPSEYASSSGTQMFNHFPHSRCICVKDSLAKIMRTCRQAYGAAYNFVPESFILPTEYEKLTARHLTKKSRETEDADVLWICKPCDMSRGRNIYLVRDPVEVDARDVVIVQQYVNRPLLLGGYKVRGAAPSPASRLTAPSFAFDLRIYALVTAVHPLTVYIYQDGIVRMATQKYSEADHENLFAHLTNNSINKRSPTYGDDKDTIGPGCKWTLGQLWRHLEEEHAPGITREDLDALWQRIKAIIVFTLLNLPAEVPMSASSASAFELFGFDVMIDQNLKPWLIEVNSSPSLGIDSASDQDVKVPMLESLLHLVSLSSVSEGQRVSSTILGKPVVSSGSIWRRPGTAPASHSVPSSLGGFRLSVKGSCFQQYASMDELSRPPSRATSRPGAALDRPGTAAPAGTQEALPVAVNSDGSLGGGTAPAPTQLTVSTSDPIAPAARHRKTSKSRAKRGQPAPSSPAHQVFAFRTQLVPPSKGAATVASITDGVSLMACRSGSGGAAVSSAESPRSLPWGASAQVATSKWASSQRIARPSTSSPTKTRPQPHVNRGSQPPVAAPWPSSSRFASCPSTPSGPRPASSAGLPNQRAPNHLAHSTKQRLTSSRQGLPRARGHQATAHALRCRLKSLPMLHGKFERAFPFSDETTDLAIRLKPQLNRQDFVRIVREVIWNVQATHGSAQ